MKLVAGIPRWMSLLGVSASVLPSHGADPATGPVLVIGSLAGAIAVPLDDEQRTASSDTTSSPARIHELVA